MIPPTVKIFVCTQPQDMRRTFDGLGLATREVLPTGWSGSKTNVVLSSLAITRTTWAFSCASLGT